MEMSVPPRRYASHIALVSSIYEPSNCLEEERCDTLMDNGVKVVSIIVVDDISVE